MIFVGMEAPPLVVWYTTLNRACKEVGASAMQRRSVPVGKMDFHAMKTFLLELQQESQNLRKLKLVVLGHGRIGKTTLLTAIHNILDPLNPRVVCERSINIFIVR